MHNPVAITSSRFRVAVASDRGEVSSWLVLAAGLVLATLLAAGTMRTLIMDLAGNVGTSGGIENITTGSRGGPIPIIGGAPVAPPAPLPGAPGDGSPTVPSGPVDPAAIGATDDARDALENVGDILDRGDDNRVDEDEMNDIHDYLQSLTDDERAFVIANLSDDQLQALINGIDQGGRWPWNGWNDNEKAAFYETLSSVGNSPLALAQLESALPIEDYLDFLVTIDTDHMNGEWPNGAASDILIRDSINSDYLENAIDDGRQAEGTLAIVDDHNFELAYAAYTAQRPEGSRTPDRWMDLNGFVDHEDRQWVRASSANAGTPIHEAVHNYSESALSRETAQPLNEGVTEYFSRQVIATTDDPATVVDEAQQTIDQRGNIYPQNLAFTEALVGVVGEDVVAAAYFDGDVDGLEQAYIDATGRTAEDWDTLLDHINNRNASGDRRPEWSDAADLLDEVTP